MPDQRDQRFEQMKRELALSAEQAAQLDVYRTTFHAELDSLSTQLITVRIQLAHVLSEERSDTTQTNSILDNISHLQLTAQRRVISHLLSVKSILNPEQQTKFFAIVLERFSSASDQPMPGRPSH
jgi:Spy/CpxP family protein refolding chaperone